MSRYVNQYIIFTTGISKLSGTIKAVQNLFSSLWEKQWSKAFIKASEIASP